MRRKPKNTADHAALSEVFGELRQQVNQWFVDHTIANIIEKERSRESVSFDI